ncbi:N-6 DNA methylase [Herbidospora cretacea]|uniref:N-6 DNA methylase n=1 Tax=Herbidospora cretacea TaxID=28444 RepID=UPI00068F1845|nr:N-6 DNA methylase [Herbidospora cretacea]
MSGVIALMSMPEIAEMAGVQRPVVSNWRRRHTGFPQFVGRDGGQPFFDAHEVVEWLVGTGRVEARQASEDLSLFLLARLGRALPGRDLIAAVTSLVCLRFLGDDEPLAGGTGDVLSDLRDRALEADGRDEMLRSEINAIPTGCAWLAEAVDDLVEATYGCANAFERLLSKRHRFDAADLYTSAINPELARLIAEVSGVREKARETGSALITDLTAGPGDLLAAAAQLLHEDSPRFAAAETDPYLVRLIRRRLTVHEIPLIDVDIRTGDHLPDETGDPDVILTQVPYQPVEERSALDVLARIDDISLRLAPGRTAVVLGPADVLTGELKPYSPEERARANLLNTGMVEAVIRLPGGLVPYRPGYQTAVWVLTSAHDPKMADRVLLADVSEQSLTADVVDALIEDVATWRRVGFSPQDHVRRFAVQVRVNDLVAFPKPLTASPVSALPGTAVATATMARANELEQELYRAASRDEVPIRAGLAESTGLRPTTVTLGKVIRDGQVTLRRGTRLNPDHLGDSRSYVVLGAPEILGRCRPGTRMVDILTLGEHYPRAQLTEPGDVIVTTTPEMGVLVDHDGRSLVEFPARVLRISDTGRDQFPPLVLAALLMDNASVRVTGSLRLARRLEEHRLPLLPPDLVPELNRFLTVQDERRRQARREIELLDDLTTLAVTGLATGTLVLRHSTEKETHAPA